MSTEVHLLRTSECPVCGRHVSLDMILDLSIHSDTYESVCVSDDDGNQFSMTFTSHDADNLKTLGAGGLWKLHKERAGDTIGRLERAIGNLDDYEYSTGWKLSFLLDKARDNPNAIWRILA